MYIIIIKHEMLADDVELSRSTHQQTSLHNRVASLVSTAELNDWLLTNKIKQNDEINEVTRSSPQPTHIPSLPTPLSFDSLSICFIDPMRAS